MLKALNKLPSLLGGGAQEATFANISPRTLPQFRVEYPMPDILASYKHLFDKFPFSSGNCTLAICRAYLLRTNDSVSTMTMLKTNTVAIWTNIFAIWTNIVAIWTKVFGNMTNIMAYLTNFLPVQIELFSICRGAMTIWRSMMISTLKMPMQDPRPKKVQLSLEHQSIAKH